jgi:hypothetical protein
LRWNGTQIHFIEQFVEVDAINACPLLSIKFPMTPSELLWSATDFNSLNSHGILNGCVAALDGWLCHIHAHPATEVEKEKSYFSGHYQCYGLNVQATCDVSCHFISLSALCLGSTSESKAFMSHECIT